MQEFYLKQSDYISLHCCAWYPEGQPRAVVQIIHGVAEYGARYDDFATFLASKGILVVAEDHPGHGKTVTAEGILGYMSGGWDGTLDGIHMLYSQIHAQYPDAPYFMLGHSMGSFLLRTYLFDDRCSIDGTIISGTAWQPSLMLKAGQLVCAIETKRHGKMGHSKLLQSLIFDAYNQKFKPNRTSCDWLSRDEAVVDCYVNDPLCGFSATVQLCDEMFGGIARIQNMKNLNRMQRSIPVYFVAGDHDPVGDMGKGVLRTVQAFQQICMQNVEVSVYQGMRHEILNEIGKNTVYNDILDWISAKIKA